MAITATATRVIEIDVRASANASAHVAQIAGQLGSIEKNAANASRTTNSLLSGLSNMAKGMVGFFAVERILDFGAALNRVYEEQLIIVERFKLITGSAEGASDAFGEIVRIARETGRELDGVSKLYEKVMRNAENLGITTKGVTLITEGFAASLRVSGASTQEANAAMMQFAQALASGKLSGDEFRSIMENNTVFMVELANAAKMTLGEIRELSRKGGTDAEWLREQMFKLGEDGKNALQRLQEQASKIPFTFAQAWNSAKAGFADFINSLGQGAEHTEGIFARLARRIGENLSNAATANRQRAFVADRVNQALARARGEPEPIAEAPWASQRGQGINNEIERLERNEEKLRQQLDKYAALNDKNSVQMTESLKMELVKTRAERDAWKEVLTNQEGKDIAKANAPFLVEGWKPSTSKDDSDGKGSKKRNPFAEFLDDLQDAKKKVEEEAIGYGEWRHKLEKIIREGQRETGKLFPWGEAPMESARRLADQWDERVRQMEEVEDSLKRQTKANEEVERMYLERQKSFGNELEKLYNQYNEETGERMLPWQRRLAKLQDWIKENQPFIKDEDMTRISKITDWMSWESEKEKIVEMFKQDGASMGGEDPVLEYAEAFSNAFDRMLDSILEFNKTGKELIGDFVEDFLKQMARIAMRRATADFAEVMLGQITDFASNFLPQAKGGAWHNGVQFYANGAVFDQPTGFKHSGGLGVLGEAGPEAVMPLKRGADGKLGVGTTPVTVNVFNNAPGTKARTEERTNSRGEREITVIVEEVVEQALGGGRYDKVLQNSFNINRRGRG